MLGQAERERWDSERGRKVVEAVYGAPWVRWALCLSGKAWRLQRWDEAQMNTTGKCWETDGEAGTAQDSEAVGMQESGRM